MIVLLVNHIDSSELAPAIIFKFWVNILSKEHNTAGPVFKISGSHRTFTENYWFFDET